MGWNVQAAAWRRERSVGENKELLHFKRSNWFKYILLCKSFIIYFLFSSWGKWSTLANLANATSTYTLSEFLIAPKFSHVFRDSQQNDPYTSIQKICEIAVNYCRDSPHQMTHKGILPCVHLLLHASDVAQRNQWGKWRECTSTTSVGPHDVHPRTID